MDKDLFFLSHLKKLENKLSKSVGILNKVNRSWTYPLYFNCITSFSILIFNTPSLYLYMGLNIWILSEKIKYFSKQSCQNNSRRVMVESATPFYVKLKIFKIRDMYLLEPALFMLKFQEKQLPSSFLDYFKLTNAIHAKQRRSSTNSGGQ